jgi:hypothetical protein
MPERHGDRPFGDVPGLYVITVEGMLDAGWSARFGEMQILHIQGLPTPRTQLTGWLQDQGALHGILATLNGLAMPILSLERVRTAGSPDPG